MLGIGGQESPGRLSRISLMPALATLTVVVKSWPRATLAEAPASGLLILAWMVSCSGWALLLGQHE